MLFTVVLMALCLLAAGAVAAYVAFPRRGVRLPVAPRAGDALARLVDSLPTVEPVGSAARRTRD